MSKERFHLRRHSLRYVRYTPKVSFEVDLTVSIDQVSFLFCELAAVATKAEFIKGREETLIYGT